MMLSLVEDLLVVPAKDLLESRSTLAQYTLWSRVNQGNASTDSKVSPK